MSNRCSGFFAALWLAALLLGAGRPAGAADVAVALPDGDRARLDKYLGQGVVGGPLPSAALMRPEAYLPPKGIELSYRVLEVNEGPRTETHKIKDTTEAPFAPGWHYATDPTGSTFLQRTSDGGAVVVAEMDLSREVLSRFTPGAPLIVTGLLPGENRRVTIKVEVSDLSDPSDIEHTGWFDVLYTYIGTYVVTVPAGSYDAVLIRWDYKGDIGLAHIEKSEYRLLAPSAGLVAMVELRTVSAVLIYRDHTNLAKLLEKVE
jgi:hypothetical protein